MKEDYFYEEEQDIMTSQKVTKNAKSIKRYREESSEEKFEQVKVTKLKNKQKAPLNQTNYKLMIKRKEFVCGCGKDFENKNSFKEHVKVYHEGVFVTGSTHYISSVFEIVIPATIIQEDTTQKMKNESFQSQYKMGKIDQKYQKASIFKQNKKMKNAQIKRPSQKIEKIIEAQEQKKNKKIQKSDELKRENENINQINNENAEEQGQRIEWEGFVLLKNTNYRLAFDYFCGKCEQFNGKTPRQYIVHCIEICSDGGLNHQNSSHFVACEMKEASQNQNTAQVKKQVQINEIKEIFKEPLEIIKDTQNSFIDAELKKQQQNYIKRLIRNSNTLPQQMPMEGFILKKNKEFRLIEFFEKRKSHEKAHFGDRIFSYICGKCLETYFNAKTFFFHLAMFCKEYTHPLSSFHLSYENGASVQLGFEVLNAIHFDFDKYQSNLRWKITKNNQLTSICSYRFKKNSHSHKKIKRSINISNQQFYCGKCDNIVLNPEAFLNHLFSVCQSFIHQKSSHFISQLNGELITSNSVCHISVISQKGQQSAEHEGDVVNVDQFVDREEFVELEFRQKASEGEQIKLEEEQRKLEEEQQRGEERKQKLDARRKRARGRGRAKKNHILYQIFKENASQFDQMYCGKCSQIFTSHTYYKHIVNAHSQIVPRNSSHIILRLKLRQGFKIRTVVMNNVVNYENQDTERYFCSCKPESKMIREDFITHMINIHMGISPIVELWN